MTTLCYYINFALFEVHRQQKMFGGFNLIARRNNDMIIEWVKLKLERIKNIV